MTKKNEKGFLYADDRNHGPVRTTLQPTPTMRKRWAEQAAKEKKQSKKK